LLAQVYVELNGGRQIGLEMVAEEAASAAGASAPVLTLVRRDRPFRAPRPHSASAEELAAHSAFVDTLDNPLWRDGAAAHA